MTQSMRDFTTLPPPPQFHNYTLTESAKALCFKAARAVESDSAIPNTMDIASSEIRESITPLEQADPDAVAAEVLEVEATILDSMEIAEISAGNVEVTVAAQQVEKLGTEDDGDSTTPDSFTKQMTTSEDLPDAKNHTAEIEDRNTVSLARPFHTADAHDEKSKRTADEALASEPKRTCTEDPPKPAPNPIIKLPLFERARVGDVAVVLNKENPTHQYRLDRLTLEHWSVGFLDLFRDAEKQYPPSDRDVKFLLVLSEHGSPEFPALVPRPITDFSPMEPNSAAIEESVSWSDAIDATKIKAEPMETDAPIPARQKEQEIHDVRAAYKIIFTAVHSMNPKLDKITHLNGLLVAAETVLTVAKIYDLTLFVQDKITSAIHQHHKDLFLAIKDDPPRWLNLAISLQDFAVFKEAMVHLVGAYPEYLAHWTTDKLPKDIETAIEKKAKALQYDVLITNMDMTMNTLTTGPKAGRGRLVTRGGDYESWTAMSLWQDWFRTHLRSIQMPKPKGSRAVTFNPMEIGSLYYTIHRSGEAYLKINELKRELFSAERSWEDVDDDMKKLKKYAKTAVAPLVDNKLMISPDKHKIGYLTCAEIKEEDAPWNTA